MEHVSGATETLSYPDVGPKEMYAPRGEEFDRGPVPVLPLWSENVFVGAWAIVPILAQWALLRFTGAADTMPFYRKVHL